MILVLKQIGKEEIYINDLKLLEYKKKKKSALNYNLKEPMHFLSLSKK